MEEVTIGKKSPLKKYPHNFSSNSSVELLVDTKKIKPNKKYVCFEDAHLFAISLELKTRKEWRLYVKGGMLNKPERPEYIPAHPDGIYKIKGWQGWKYWLGTADRSLLQ